MTEPAPTLVNIGCAQSSGSTALSHALDRHPAVACGAEMFLFCQPLLYDDYGKFRRRRRLIRLIGLCGNPYSANRAVFRHLRDYGLSKSQVWRWAKESADLPALAARVQEHVRTLTGKPIWAEKTPWNIRVIGKFLAAFPAAKVIHVVRDPRDVILSLKKRDRHKGLLPAAEHWLTSVAAVAPFRERPNVLEVRYEDLCTDTNAALGRICAFLGVPFDPAYFADDTHAGRGLTRWEGHGTWDRRPGEGFSAGSVGKHASAGVDWRVLGNVRLSAEFAALLGTRPRTIPELAALYGYDVPASTDAKTFRPFPTPRRLDPFRRLLDRMMGMHGYVTQIELSGDEF
jgi:hypothetical protein